MIMNALSASVFTAGGQVQPTVRFEASLLTPAYELIFPIAAMPIIPFNAMFVKLFVGRVMFRIGLKSGDVLPNSLKKAFSMSEADLLVHRKEGISN